MASLVQYDFSDDSNDDTSEETVTSILNTDETPLPPIKSSIFTNLPQPKSRVIGTVEEDDVLKTNSNLNVTKEVESNKKPSIKISIPLLSDFQNEDDDLEPTVKKQKLAKGSGLFNILPQPKSTPVTTKSFIPNILTTKKNIPHPASTSKIKQATVATESDDEFAGISDTYDDATWERLCGRKKKPVKRVPIQSVSVDSKSIELAPETNNTHDMLDNKAFKELVGSTKKRINIKLVDINEEEILAEKDTWMAKSLTDPACEPKYEAEDPVTNTCKKRHHITYLVQQAKENEQDLKNQWAANKFTRKQTQAKYGF